MVYRESRSGNTVVTHSLFSEERRWPMRFWLLVCFVLVLGNIGVYWEIFVPAVVTVSVLDVGKKGRAVLVRVPRGRTLLIDTGPDASILRALGETLPMWQRSIDAAALTGAGTSFAGGLPDVESRYAVSSRMQAGTRSTPYGAAFLFGGMRIEISAPGTFTVSYGATTLSISSSTPIGAYISDGKTITQN